MHLKEGAKGTCGDAYSLDTGRQGAGRLRLLNKVYGPVTRRLLIEAGMRSGVRALDLACGIGAVSCWMAVQAGESGHVAALDVNPDQLLVARKHCEACAHCPIAYHEGSAYETGLPNGWFDIVHARLLLCHLTEPSRVLHEVHRLLKPGGVFVCQDLRISGISCVPECAAYRTMTDCAIAMGKALGVDYDYGIRLPIEAEEAGFRVLDMRFDSPAYLRGEEKRLWEFTFAEAGPAMVRTGAISETELTTLLNGLRRTAEDERTLIALASLAGMIAVKQ
jgi:SAM-dependent methyltransferase